MSKKRFKILLLSLAYFVFPKIVLAQAEVLRTTPPPLIFILVVVRNVIFVLGGIISLGFLAMLIVGGFRLLFAGGDPKALSDAKNVLTFAALGLFLAFSAYLVIALIAQFTGVSGLGIFSLAQPNLLDPWEICYQTYGGTNDAATICTDLFRRATAP